MKMSEKDFQSQIVQIAKLNKWLVYHTYDSRKSEPGFPDLVLVRESVIFAELKKDAKTAPSQAQMAWLGALEKANARCAVWYPEIMDDIQIVLETGDISKIPKPSPGVKRAMQRFHKKRNEVVDERERMEREQIAHDSVQNFNAHYTKSQEGMTDAQKARAARRNEILGKLLNSEPT